MAVKAPNPPTPPTPPSVPGVTIQEGGSVTQSNAPPANGTTSRSTDNEKQMEEQAKSAVAQGEGGLSRTTRKNLSEEAREAKAAAQKTAQDGRDQARTTVETGRNQASQAAQNAGAGSVTQAEGESGALQGQTESPQVPAAPIPDSPSYHGVLYWGPMLAVIFVMAFVLVKKFLHRQGRQGELTKADLDNDALGAVESSELRGMKPDQVLAKIRAGEEAALRKKAPAPSPQIKRRAVTQSEAQRKPVESRAKKKSPGAAPEDEHKHFEVRI